MELELKLKHVLAYFQHGILVHIESQGSIKLEKPLIVSELGNVLIDKVGWCGIRVVKLSLKSLSKLTSEELFSFGFTNPSIGQILGDHKGAPIEDIIHNCKYGLVQYLLSQHYDIFGLIEAGLAVEKE